MISWNSLSLVYLIISMPLSIYVFIFSTYYLKWAVKNVEFRREMKKERNFRTCWPMEEEPEKRKEKQILRTKSDAEQNCPHCRKRCDDEQTCLDGMETKCNNSDYFRISIISLIGSNASIDFQYQFALFCLQKFVVPFGCGAQWIWWRWDGSNCRNVVTPDTAIYKHNGRTNIIEMPSSPENRKKKIPLLTFLKYTK